MTRLSEEHAVNWKDFSARIDRDNLSFYSRKDWSDNDPVNRPILLATPALSRTGAPVALCHMAGVLVREGHTVFVLCGEAGALGESFLDTGSHILICPAWQQDRKWLLRLAELFDILIVNTLDYFLDLPLLAACFKNVFWWLHESEFLFTHALKRQAVSAMVFHEEAMREIPANVHVLCVSSLVKKHAEQYLGIRHADILPYCVPDTETAPGAQTERTGDHPLSVLQAGTLDHNKGQDLLIDAVLRLPEAVFENCRFTFVGSREGADPEILDSVCMFAEQFYNVRLLPSMPQMDLYTLYDETDIVVIPSRQESLPTVAVEAMMKGKLCICTDNTGLRDFAEDGDGILYFPSGDADALAERITYAVRQWPELVTVRRAAREVYERCFTERIHRKKLLEILQIDK